MNMAVLLLDMTYEPLKIICWEDAMKLLVEGNAEIVEDSGHVIRSAHAEWTLPSVIRQLNKFRKKGLAKFSRLNIYMRDNWTCQYCLERKNTKDLTFDHVVPRAKGGKTNWTNIVTACRPCNSYKEDRTPEQAKMKLKTAPVEPKFLPAQIVIRMKSIPEKWVPYIDERSLTYWTAELETE
jgi:5-methylcytosine-specific restriction endonuclease McrA